MKFSSSHNLQELKQAETLADELHQAIAQEREKFGKVVSKVVHDISSPLASLSMIVDVCHNIPEGERLALREVANSIGDVVNNLLGCYKKDDNNAASQAKEYKPVLLSLELKNILSEKKYQYQDLPVKFNYSCDLDSSFLCAVANSFDFKRMISSLINNSVEAFDKKGGVVELKIKKVGDLAQIVIEDNGCGMSQEIIDKIMSNIMVTDGKKNGSGIGFAQVRETLKESQGKMLIESKIGEGAKITLIFPIMNTPEWIVREIILNKGDMVVVLDDDSTIHKAWEARFYPYGEDIQLYHFELGVDAIQFIKELPIKNKVFLLSDFELINQEFNGLQVIERLALEERSILVTSHHGKQHIRDAASLMGVKILPKSLASEVAITVKNRELV